MFWKDGSFWLHTRPEFTRITDTDGDGRGDRFETTCSGIRSPGGIGFNAKGDAFHTDNQGFWNGSSSLK